MKPGTLSLTIVVTIFVFLHNQDGVRGEEKEKSCKSLVAELTKKQLGGISACTKSMKFKNGKEKAKKMTCVMKCVMKKELLLNEGGQLNDEQYALFMERHFPVSLHEQIKKTFAPCVADAAKGMDDSEEYCKDYDSLLKCLMGALPNVTDSAHKRWSMD